MVALEPLPVRDPGSLVRLERRSPQNYTSEMPYLSAVFYGEHAKSLKAMIAVLGVPPMQMDDDLQGTSASFATANYFSELGTPAAVGRLFDPARESQAIGPAGGGAELHAVAAPVQRRPGCSGTDGEAEPEACNGDWRDAV